MSDLTASLDWNDRVVKSAQASTPVIAHVVWRRDFSNVKKLAVRLTGERSPSAALSIGSDPVFESRLSS
jgi:hypothetical protein